MNASVLIESHLTIFAVLIELHNILRDRNNIQKHHDLCLYSITPLVSSEGLSAEKIRLNISERCGIPRTASLQRQATTVMSKDCSSLHVVDEVITQLF